jgi:hypothetical protein
MGVTKKATIVVKEATKKRGRPAGSKNKSKELSSEGWVPSVPFPAPKDIEVDWERLAKQLQKALAVEMKTVEGMEKLFEEFKSVSKKVNELTFWQRIKLVVTGMY